VKRLAVPLFAHRVVINTRTTLVQRRADVASASSKNSQPGGCSPVGFPYATAIIGLPMTGKTSLFTILTGVHQETHIAPRRCAPAWRKCRMRASNTGRLFEPPKVTHATVEYVDMPSVSKESLRDPATWPAAVVDAFAHVLRLFEDATVAHEKGPSTRCATGRRGDGIDAQRPAGDREGLERLDKDRKKIKNPEWTANSSCSKVQGHARREPPVAPTRARRRGGKTFARLSVPLAEARTLRAEPR